MGHHNITAAYGGDASFNGGTSNSVDQVVQKADTSTALVSSVNPSKFGQAVTFTATVSVVAPGAGTPTGTVTFKDGVTTLGTGTAQRRRGRDVHDGGAGGRPSHHHGDLRRRCELQREHVEHHRPGGAEGGHLDRTRILGESVKAGQSVTFTATVTVVAPGSGTPIGTVTFKDGVDDAGHGHRQRRRGGDLHDRGTCGG